MCFDFNVTYSSRRGYSLINTLKFKKKIQWGFYHHVAALESRSGKIATSSTALRRHHRTYFTFDVSSKGAKKCPVKMLPGEDFDNHKESLSLSDWFRPDRS